VLAALQAYSCLYYGVFAIVPLAIAAAATFMGAPRERRFAVARALAAAMVLAGVLCAPLVRPYAAAARVVGERTPDEVKAWSAQPADYLRAHPDNAMYGNPADPGTGERRMFPGAVAPLLGVAAFVPPVSTAAIAYLAVGLVSADLSLGFNGAGYGALYKSVLPFRALRVPARFAMIVGLALAVLSGFGVARLCRGRSQRAQLAIVTVAIALITLESRPRTLEIAELDDPAPAVYSWLATQEPGVVCEYPVGNLQRALHLVRDHEHGHAEAAFQKQNELVEPGSDDWIESRRGLVEDHDIGIEGHRPGDRGALLHPAGQLVREEAALVCQADGLELHPDHEGDDRIGQVRQLLQRQGDVLGDRHRTEQSRPLKGDADPSARHRYSVRAGAARRRYR